MNTSAMAEAAGFIWKQRKNGDVVISHLGRTATALRGHLARRFVDDAHGHQDQKLMARLTEVQWITEGVRVETKLDRGPAARERSEQEREREPGDF